jgi:hypothetical protein
LSFKYESPFNTVPLGADEGFLNGVLAVVVVVAADSIGYD